MCGFCFILLYKVFELSQTTLKPEAYPKAMPNRHYNFDVDQVKTKEILAGLQEYADSVGVTIMVDKNHDLGNAKGGFDPDKQLIFMNPHNTPGEKIGTLIHELAHATLHNPKFAEQYKGTMTLGQKEFEAEMTSYLLSKHFGLDTSEKSIQYMASWTKNLSALEDKDLAASLQRVHKTVSSMMKKIDSHLKAPQIEKERGEKVNFFKEALKAAEKGIGR
ncbi:ImmA/IrrE family metallo-endopeptidase [Streptococcus danieliae]|uniref:ImmA/IrrE family metallo-endopeptidase n=1 Tax=Streptococcus danieliae TaxID=747656 RepID=A0A7X3G9S8_9STRE|nr:ImmA/IrrE family metallo-endopeptidase [Streptococcus danieliae]